VLNLPCFVSSLDKNDSESQSKKGIFLSLNADIDKGCTDVFALGIPDPEPVPM
jgi:hypothetical protein